MIRVETRQRFGLYVHQHPGRYTLHTVIGRGSTSVVFAATNRQTGERCAIKVVPHATQKAVARLDRELIILQSLHHDHILEFHEAMRFGDVTYIVTGHCSGGDLFTCIANRRLTDQHTVRRLFHQILLAVQYLHCNGIAHLDIKAENIMLDSAGNAKLIDFGLARCQDVGGDERGGTPMYLAPELLKARKYRTRPADVWSLGILLIVMATGRVPYGNCIGREMLRKIAKGEVKCPRSMEKETAALVKKMTALEPNERPRIDELLDSPIFGDLRSEVKGNHENLEQEEMEMI
jgi:serine/threonine protein kinase